MKLGIQFALKRFIPGKSGTVYLDVIRDGQTILTKALDLNNGRASLELPLDESMAGTLELHAYRIMRNSDIVRDSRTIFVNHRKDVVLEIQTGKDSYLPGQDAVITFRTTKDNLPIPAAIGVNIVDESVFALQERESGFERLYFELERELMKPRYVIYGITLPELIYGTAESDEKTRVQAANVLMAAASENERFSLKVNSRPEKEQKIEKKKEDYFNTLFVIGKIILILMPLLIFGLGIYDHRKRKKTLLEDLGLSLLMLLLIPIAVVSLAILIFILASLLPFIGIIFTALLVLGILASIFVSFFAIIRYAKNNNQNLLWMTLLFCLYIPMIVAVLIFSLASDDLEHLAWILLSGLLIPVIYGAYAVDFFKEKSKLAIASLLVPLFTFIVLLFLLVLFALSSIIPFGGGNFLIADIQSDFSRGFPEQASIQSKSLDSPDRDSFVIPSPDSGSGDPPRVRQFFPETLYSNPQIITDGEGKASLNLTVADSITSWRIAALANSLNGDIGSGNAEMIVFQDFFVDIDLPVSLTQGDEVSIPVSVFNYLKTRQSVKLQFLEEPWFELLDEPSKTLDIGPNDAKAAYFRIKAKKLGNNKLTVYAFGNEKNDAVSRTVEIVPDGKEYRISHSDRLEGNVEKTIRFPSGAIEDSERLFVKIYPGIFSQVVEGLDSMLRMPHGCFEQTSSITYPNLLIMDYMKRTNQINPELQFKAEQYVGTGYQRLMSFESNTPGGWTWFGPPEEANMMLSAYGLMEFHDMAEVYEIDDSLIGRTQRYLVSQMNADGSFEPKGKLHTSGLATGSDVMTSTCFVGWSLAYTGYEDLEKTARYIEQNVDLEKEGSYTLALCANALAHYDRKKSLRLLQELDGRAVKDGKTIYWESPGREIYDQAVMGGRGKGKDVQTTALAALAYIEAGYGGGDVNRILTYIVNQKDGHGSWGTTFATILSLKAMINALTGNSEETDATMRILVENEPVETIHVNKDNKDVLQLVELNRYAGKGNVHVGISMEGTGNLFYQIVAAYHVPWTGVVLPLEEPINIELEYDKTSLKVNDVVTAKVRATYHGEGFVNNAIIDLGIPPGFSIISEDLQKAVEKGVIEKYDVTGRQIIIYLRFLDAGGISLEYGLKAKYPIKAKTPKSAVYDYYNPELRDESEPVEFNVE